MLRQLVKSLFVGVEVRSQIGVEDSTPPHVRSFFQGHFLTKACTHNGSTQKKIFKVSVSQAPSEQRHQAGSAGEVPAVSRTYFVSCDLSELWVLPGESAS